MTGAARGSVRGVEYRADWTEIAVGSRELMVSATTYIADGADAARPVLFCFNGGPGASSSPLHLNAFGPRRFEARGEGARTIVANPHTLLDVADLVFIDPPGTGFSGRAHTEPPVLTILDDAQAVEAMIRHWLKARGRAESPVFIAGESYGGYRLAEMCATIADIDIRGILLISPLLDASAAVGARGSDLPHILELPSLAVAAWTHAGAEPSPRSVEEVWQDAHRFAIGPYASALLAGDRLDTETAQEIGQQLADLLNIGVEEVLDADLRVDSTWLLHRLRRGEGIAIGRLDSRVTGPLPRIDSARPPGADDPALGANGRDVITSPELAAYLVELGGPAGAEYVSLSLALNFRFDWGAGITEIGASRNPTANLGTLLRARPDAAVLAFGGYHDVATPLAATEYALSHAGLPSDRVELIALDGGHSFDAQTLPVATDRIRAFIRQRGRLSTPV